MTHDDTAEFECVECSARVGSLYTKYAQQSNTSLVECRRHGDHAADAYFSFPFAIAVVDLLLVRPSVYRHLVRNRGVDGTVDLRTRHRAIETVKFAIVSISVDTLVRCVATESTLDDLDAVKLFVDTLAYCSFETSSLLLSAVFAAALVCRTNLHDLAVLPLALLYSTVPTTFLLVVSSIVWRQEYLAPSSLSLSSSLSSSAAARLFVDFVSPPSRQQQHHLETGGMIWNYVVSFSRANLRSNAAQVGNARRGWTTDEALMRKLVGATSAIVAVQVALRISKTRAVTVLGIAWLVHLVLLHALDAWIA